ncbi:hypothetical protein RBS60_00990 [Sinomonas sp. ASV486]|uniref:hypothetical protein n=1 Tax=Sinomonas sp. ASV486 TaxID=3051170 RepID=UPI0027DBC386|nr:hypothetical protein [Sinomonas sp. ASV486]MDQ4488766.1 hypothetical protein [Sinomonas sp. ASV486]
MDPLGHLIDTSRRDLHGPSADPRSQFAAGAIARLRRGFYVPTDVWCGLEADGRFRLTLAAHALANPGVVFCGETALFLHRVPTVKAPLTVDVATVTTSRLGVRPSTFDVRGESASAMQARERGSHQIRRHHHAAIESIPVGEFEAVPLADALAEVLATAKFARALTVADGVLRRQPDVPLLDRAAVADAIAALPHRSHRSRAERIARLARSGAESPGESVGRALMLLFGFPEPMLQAEHFDQLGFVGRTDYYWGDVEGNRAVTAPGKLEPVGEFDGWGKYFRTELTHGEDPREIIRREKKRENRLLGLNHPVLRLDWSDLKRPAQFRAKLIQMGLRPASSAAVADKRA